MKWLMINDSWNWNRMASARQHSSYRIRTKDKNSLIKILSTFHISWLHLAQKRTTGINAFFFSAVFQTNKFSLRVFSSSTSGSHNWHREYNKAFLYKTAFPLWENNFSTKIQDLNLRHPIFMTSAFKNDGFYYSKKCQDKIKCLNI